MTIKFYDALPKYVSVVADGNKKLPRGLKWSGVGAPPEPGETVAVKINGIGKCRVVRYFAEHGWLGLYVQPLQPPDWYVRQNRGNCECYVFGAEVGEQVRP